MITPCSLPSLTTVTNGLCVRAMTSATSMMVSSASATGICCAFVGSRSRIVLPLSYVCRVVSHGFGQHSGQTGIILHVGGHEKANHLGGG